MQNHAIFIHPLHLLLHVPVVSYTKHSLPELNWISPFYNSYFSLNFIKSLTTTVDQW